LIIKPFIDKFKINGKNRLHRKLISPINATIIKSDKITEANPQSMDYMKYRIPNMADYEMAGVSLTSEQKELYKKVRDYLWGLKGHYDFTNSRREQQNNINVPMRKCVKRLDFPGQIVLFYGKLLGKVINNQEVKDEDINTIKVFCYDKGAVKSGLDFITVRNKEIEKKTVLKKSMDWLKEYYNNNVGKSDKVMMVTLTRPKNYNITVNFESGIEYEVTQKDIDYIGDLNDKYYKCTSFDEEMYRELAKVVDYMKQNVEITPLPEPEKKDEKAESKTEEKK